MPAQRQWSRSAFVMINYEHISHLSLTLDMYLLAGKDLKDPKHIQKSFVVIQDCKIFSSYISIIAAKH